VIHHWPPIVAIQIGAVLLAVAYAQSKDFQLALATLGEWKVRGGLAFAALTGAAAGGVIPEIAKFATGQLKRPTLDWAKKCLFNAFVYSIIGIQVDLLYQGQSRWFGDGNDFKTLFIKTLVDMALFSPFISIPTATLLFDLRDRGWARVRANFGHGYIRERIMPGLVLCWIFWIPILFCIYSVARDLQYCFAVLGEAAWSILFVFMMSQRASSAPDPRDT